MPEPTVFDDLAAFFDEIPDVIRAEISLLLTVLTDDRAIEPEDFSNCERAVRDLFGASGRFGRFGDLIKAAGIIDVYFAAEPRERFDQKSLRDRYASRLTAIKRARHRWQVLRETRLSPAAINTALTAVPSPRRRSSASKDRFEDTPSNHLQTGL